tara:strand:+ start:9963 stop:10697 length:735 start_codon:yes stop_codon:yes gene_type:complete
MAIYGRRTDSSRMGSYESENSGGMSDMFDALGGAVDNWRVDNQDKVDAFKTGVKKKLGWKPELEHDGKVYEEARWGKHKGPDVLQGKSMGEAFGNVRKYFGDRLNSMKKSQEPTTGGGTVANTTIQTADPSTVKATAEGTQEGANTMETKMADFRSRDGGKGWDPSQEKWFDPNQAEQYGWVDGKWQDPVQEQGFIERIQSQVPKDADGNVKVKGGTGAHPLFGFEGLGDAWQGAKSLWGALTK